MDPNSALIQDLKSTLEYCKRETKTLSVTVREDVIDAIKQSPEYLQWAFNHGIRHAQMQIADVIIKAFTLLIVDLDESENRDFDYIVEELVTAKEHRSQLLSAQGYQRLQFVHALKASMALPLNSVHSLDELKETADALCMVVSKLSGELVTNLEMLKTFEV